MAEAEVPLRPLKLYLFSVLKIDPVGALIEPPSEIATKVDITRLAELLIQYHEETGKGIYAVRLGYEDYPISIIFTDEKPQIDGNMVKIPFFSILGFAIPDKLEGVIINHERLIEAVYEELDLDSLHGILDGEVIRELGLDREPVIMIPMSRVLSISDHPPRAPNLAGEILKLLGVVAVYVYLRRAGG